MAVEILILSGARQGDRLVLDGRQFQVGSDPACDVFFDPGRDPAIQGRSAVFRLQDDGWHVHGAGGEILVNQQPIVGWMRLRSGDLVRMSQSGPDFSFAIVAAATATPPKPPPAATFDMAPNPPPELPAIDSRTAGPEPTPAASSPIQPRADRSWAVPVGIGLAACLVVVLIVRSTFTTPTVIVNVSQPGTPAPVASSVPSGPNVAAAENKKMPEAGRSEADNSADHQQPANKGPVPVAPTADKGKKAADEKAPPLDIAAQLSESVFLTQVETAGRTWPYATCVAIGNDTLLTTAREAAQLAAWRAEKGFKIWVTRQAAGFKEEVQDIRIHGLFASLPEESNEGIFVDLGLLTVRTKLLKAAPLALPEELAELKEGLPVSCFGFAPEGGKITEFDKFEPQLNRGKVFVVIGSQKLPSKAWELGVTAEIPKNAYGSPIVNAKGKIIGIYGEAATPPGDNGARAGAPALKNLHYAPVVNSELIKNDKVWVPAAAAPTVQRPQDKR
jgi:hypothetical protein